MITEDQKIIIDLLSNDSSIIGIRPYFNNFTGSPLATMLLSQILYWASKSNNSFYKFIAPCDHPKYNEGDSWCEELFITRRQFDGAIKKLKEKSLVEVKSTQDRITYFSVNYSQLIACVKENSLNTKMLNRKTPKSEIVNTKMLNRKTPKSEIVYITENTTKTTTENTTNIKKINKKKNNFDLITEVEKTTLGEEQKTLLTSYWQETKKGAKTAISFAILIRELYKLSPQLQLVALEKAYQAGYASISAEWFNKTKAGNYNNKTIAHNEGYKKSAVGEQIIINPIEILKKQAVNTGNLARLKELEQLETANLNK